MDHLNDFENQERFTIFDKVFAIVLLPIALPMFLLKLFFKKLRGLTGM